MATTAVRTGNFKARDENGNTHLLSIFATYETVQGNTTRGADEIRTASGLRVTRLERGRYQVADNGTVLESDDASAP
jgi:hypothetical protein